jgi:hypothetical protein
LNEGIRRKKGLWREAGRKQLQSVALAPWASQRRHDLLELLDRLSPRIAELSERVEEEARKCPVAQRLMTHPGVGPLTALAFVLPENHFNPSEAGVGLSVEERIWIFSASALVGSIRISFGWVVRLPFPLNLFDGFVRAHRYLNVSIVSLTAQAAHYVCWHGQAL